MSKTEVSSRKFLGFIASVHSSFRFLLDLGFKVTKEEDDTYVRYESSQVFVNVYHGRQSFELGLEIGELTKPGTFYTLDEITQLSPSGKLLNFTFFQASSKERVVKYVAEMAKIVEGHAVEVLQGDRESFEQLGNIRASRWENLKNEMELREVREKLDLAWRQKEYRVVVHLLEPIEDLLTTAEVKKLHYARKQILKH